MGEVSAARLVHVAIGHCILLHAKGHLDFCCKFDLIVRRTQRCFNVKYNAHNVGTA